MGRPSTLIARALVMALLAAGSAAAGPATPADGTETGSAGPVPLSDCVGSDNGDPDLTSFTVTPTSVDVRDHAAWVNLRATASDDGGPGSATGVETVEAHSFLGDVPLAQQSDGSWRARIRIPRGLERGRFSFSSIYLSDRAGHYRYYNSPWLHQNGYGIDITVRSHPDRANPTLRSLRVTPRNVDTRRRAQRVAFTAHVTDDQSGLEHVLVTVAGSRGPLGGQLRLRHGTIRDGIWRGHATIPRWTGTRLLQLFVETRDNTGRGDQLYGDALVALHLPSQIGVRSRTESSRPTVLSAASTPTNVDATTADARYIVSVRASDTISGLALVGVQVITPWMQKEGADLDDVDYQTMRLVSGTHHRGTWQASIDVSRCWSDSGRYVLRVFVTDRAGNHRDPVARTSVTVATNDNQAPYPSYADPSKGTTTQPVTYKFSEDVVGIADTSAPVRAGGPWLARYTTNIAPGPQPGTWACATSTKQPVDCWAGPVRYATWTPTIPLTPGQEYGVDFNPEHVLDVTDLAGNPINQWYIVTWTVSG